MGQLWVSAMGQLWGSYGAAQKCEASCVAGGRGLHPTAMGQGYGAAMGQGAMGQLWGGAAVRGSVHCRWTRITSSNYVSVLWGNYGSGLWDSYGAARYGAAMGRRSDARHGALQVDEDYIQ